METIKGFHKVINISIWSPDLSKSEYPELRKEIVRHTSHPRKL